MSLTQLQRERVAALLADLMAGVWTADGLAEAHSLSDSGVRGWLRALQGAGLVREIQSAEAKAKVWEWVGGAE